MRILTNEEQKAQGARCGCRGIDDYCVCQNVPDRTTLETWGLTQRTSVPYAHYNLLDLLRKIADPANDPNMDISDGHILLDYWRHDAQRLLQAVEGGEIALNEDAYRLLTDAERQAQTLRDLRTEYRSPSANFPSMAPVKWAQDAARTIDDLVSALRNAERHIARASGDGETDIRAELNAVISNAESQP